MRTVLLKWVLHLLDQAVSLSRVISPWGINPLDPVMQQQPLTPGKITTMLSFVRCLFLEWSSMYSWNLWLVRERDSWCHHIETKITTLIIHTLTTSTLNFCVTPLMLLPILDEIFFFSGGLKYCFICLLTVSEGERDWDQSLQNPVVCLWRAMTLLGYPITSEKDQWLMNPC